MASRTRARNAPAPAAAPATGRPGTSLQGNRVSYYSQPGRGQVVTTTSGLQGRRQPGGTYQLRTSGGQQLQGRLPSRTYHRIVLAEFVATVLIIGASPLIVPAKQTAASDAAAAAATVSFAGPLVRLTATCVIFFILALLATGDRAGKFAAAFGGLIVAGAALNATDLWTGLASAFTGRHAGGEGG